MKTCKLPILTVIVAFSASLSAAQAPPHRLSPGTALPIQFEHSIDSNHAHPGDAVIAETTQLVQLANGQTLPAGMRVIGHVVGVHPFQFDKTPYAKQSPSTLAIQFDSVETKGETIPLHVYVRAVAGTLAVWGAERPQPSDMDPLSTTTQIGGDRVVPSQNEVTSPDGDVVGYQRHGGVYAHLISGSGNSSDGCDATDTEQSMGPFSASACGLYGFVDVKLESTGKTRGDSTLALVARRAPVKIWAKSAALLEVIDEGSPGISR